MDDIRKITILEALDELFPDAHCELTHRNHFELLIAVMLSAQTTDVAVNKVTPQLFQAFPTPEKMANADVKEIEQLIKSIGLYKTKARNAKRTSELLVSEYGGKVPNTRKELMTLPGVGRKTANVVLSVAFNIPALAVDTHVDRVSKRLGIAPKKASVLEVEKLLMETFPKKRWNKLHHQLIFFGRYHCISKKPQCGACPLYDICQFEDKEIFKLRMEEENSQ